MSSVDIKNAVKAVLDTLVNDVVLASASITDIKRDPLAADFPSFPHACVMPPAIESEPLDNRSNVRTYTYDVMVLFNAENLADATALEETVEAILDKFDNNPTLSGTAMAGVLPVSSAPQPFQHNGRDMIMVVVQIQAKQHVSLTFN